jgi:hypothetical protein
MLDNSEERRRKRRLYEQAVEELRVEQQQLQKQKG